MLWRHRRIGLTPPDGACRLGVAYDELVLGRTAGVLARRDHEGAVPRQQPFGIPHRLFNELRRAQVMESARMAVDSGQHGAREEVGHG